MPPSHPVHVNLPPSWPPEHLPSCPAGLWGRYWFQAPGARVFQELQIRVPPGPLIIEHSRLVTHYLSTPPLLAGEPERGSSTLQTPSRGKGI